MFIITLCAVIVFGIVMWLITLGYKALTGREMDFSAPVKEKCQKDTPARRWLNDRKLTRRWQVAESMRLSNEGRAPVGNKEDRFRLTPTKEEILDAEDDGMKKVKVRR
jgi:hypothetical protein